MKRSVCTKCNTEFECGPKNDEACWCTYLPNIVPMDAEACMCPDCLKKEIAKLEKKTLPGISELRS